MTPASAPRCRIAYASTGVGSGWGSTTARPPIPTTTAQVSCAKTSELVRASKPTTTNGSGSSGLEVGGEAGRGADDHGAVHPVRTAAEAAAQPGGAELEHPGHRVGQLGRRGRVTRLRGGRPGPRARRGSRHPGRRRPRPARRRGGRRAVRSAASGTAGLRSGRRRRRAGDPQRSAASRPASRTSSWSSGVVEMPAAGLVTSEMPSTSRPLWRAAIASRAVDIPTRSPPRMPAIRTSAGRLVVRPAELHVDALVEVGVDLLARGRAAGASRRR